MYRHRFRLSLLLLVLPVLLAASALVYMTGMLWLEDEPRSFWQALEWAAETLSTTGYGRDHSWHHPVMVLFVVALQFIGVFLVFLVIPLALVPILEQRFQTRLPTTIGKLRDHVVIFRYGAAVATLLGDLERAGLKPLVIEPDETVARRLHEDGRRVVFRSIDEGALERAHLLSARALIANGQDDEDAAVILAARQLGFTGEILALVEDPAHRQPIVLAGATGAFTPRHLLGAALAARASRRIRPTIAGIQHLGRHLQVSEVRVDRRSGVAGKRLAEIDIGSRPAVQVIAQWRGGRLISPVTPNTRLGPDSILVLVGTETGIERFQKVCEGVRPLRSEGPFLIAGYGEVGRKVAELLIDVGEEVRTIDRQPAEGVTLVGNVLDVKVLNQAGLSEAQAVVLALDTDSATLFATVILKDLCPEVPVIARVNRSHNQERLHQAGAEFALSISQVSGQLLAARLLQEEAVSIDPHLKVIKVSGRSVAGLHPASADIRERTGCSIVAVERNEEIVVDFNDDFRIDGGDAVFICGSTEATRHF
jgi:voltage-gated potassium channel